MKKEIKEGQGFICKDLEEKKRIWQKLTEAGYPMYADGNDPCYKHIIWEDGEFVEETNQNNIQPLNEAEFFGENEWTPKAGEWVEVSDVRNYYGTVKHQYLCTIDGLHLCVDMGKDYQNSNEFILFKYIRQIQPETITMQEAQEKLRELLNNPKLTIEL
jgi:hypothetical protein